MRRMDQERYLAMSAAMSGSISSSSSSEQKYLIGCTSFACFFCATPLSFSRSGWPCARPNPSLLLNWSFGLMCEQMARSCPIPASPCAPCELPPAFTGRLLATRSSASLIELPQLLLRRCELRASCCVQRSSGCSSQGSSGISWLSELMMVARMSSPWPGASSLCTGSASQLCTNCCGGKTRWTGCGGKPGTNSFGCGKRGRGTKQTGCGWKQRGAAGCGKKCGPCGPKESVWLGCGRQWGRGRSVWSEAESSRRQWTAWRLRSERPSLESGCGLSMLRMASNLSGISTSWRRAQLRTSTLASSKRLPLPRFCSKKSLKEGAGSVSGSVLLATMATIASTISSWPFWRQSAKAWLGGQLTERSALTQTLRLPCWSTQTWLSSTWKYLECSQMRPQPSKHSMSTQRLSGKGMSLISLSRTLTCSTYTRAEQLEEQSSWLGCWRMKRVLTTLGWRLRQLKDLRQQLNSSSLGQISRYSSTFSPVRRCRSVRNAPHSSPASSSGRYSQSSALNSGVSIATDCLLPITLYQSIKQSASTIATSAHSVNSYPPIFNMVRR